MDQKRTVTALLALLLVVPSIGSAAQLLTDIEGNPREQAIQGLLDRGIVEGYGDSTFRPEVTVNRAEFLKILIGSRFPGRVPHDPRCFSDLEVKVPQWYANSVCTARDLGIVSGYADGTFKPERTVNLAEALKMAFRSFGIFPHAEPKQQWFEPYLIAARDRGILIRQLSEPNRPLTRGDMAELTYRLVLAAEHTAEHVPETAAICGNGIKEGKEQCDDGNILDSDGCSSICILVPEPVRRAILQIDAQATGTITTVSRGQSAVPLLKFTVAAARQDALLTVLTFTPTVGSLVYGTHYTLRMDRNGTGAYDTVVEANGKTDGANLIFDALDGHGIVIPKGMSIPFELTADLVSTLGPVSLGMNFATDTPDYVQAQGFIDNLVLTGIETNNACTDAGGCFLRVNTQATTDITVVERGSLFIIDDAQPANGHLLLGGTETPLLLRLRLHATGEPIDLHEIRIDGVTNSVDSLSLLVLAGGTSTPVALATNGQCSDQPSSRVCAVLPFRTLVIPANQDIVIGIAARMKNDQLGGLSGEHITLSIATATDGRGLAIKARGIASNQDLEQNNGDSGAVGEVFVGTSLPTGNRQILGRTNDTTLANIAAITNAGAATSTSIPAGNTTIGSFRIDAVPHGNSMNGSNDVLLRTLTFSVSAQNVQIDPASYSLTSSGEENPSLSCSASGATGDITVTCSNIDTSAIQSRINQGSWMIVKLKANVTNTSIAPGVSSLVVSLPILGTRSQTNSVSWSDEITTFTWVDIPVSSVSSTVFQTR